MPTHVRVFATSPLALRASGSVEVRSVVRLERGRGLKVRVWASLLAGGHRGATSKPIDAHDDELPSIAQRFALEDGAPLSGITAEEASELVWGAWAHGVLQGARDAAAEPAELAHFPRPHGDVEDWAGAFRRRFPTALLRLAESAGRRAEDAPATAILLLDADHPVTLLRDLDARPSEFVRDRRTFYRADAQSLIVHPSGTLIACAVGMRETADLVHRLEQLTHGALHLRSGTWSPTHEPILALTQRAARTATSLATAPAMSTASARR